MNSSRAASPFRSLFERGSWTGLDDARLLERYARLGDRDAFEALTTRHGPMVMGVCRRILVEPSDVDDAFQATFLVLIRRARSLGPGDVLAAWLHGVATKVARRARMDRARRRARERDGLAVDPGREPDPPDFALREVIDEEVGRLPWKYRAPVSLCCLQGLTHEEAAARLGWPVGSVKGRLARARSLLGSRLTRRGVTAGAGTLALEGLAPAAVPDALAGAVALAAARVAEGVAWSFVLSYPVVKLSKGACGAMIVTKPMATALAASVMIAVAGVGVATARSNGQKRAPTPTQASLPKAEVPTPPSAFDNFKPVVDSNPKSAVILKKLDEPVSMNFPNDTPLEDVLKYIKEVIGGDIPIYIEPIGLGQTDEVTTTPVTIDLEGVPLRRTLHLILKQLGLVYYVEDGILVITSPERAEEGMGADRARPSRRLEEMDKAERGELTLQEMQDLAQKLKLIDELRKTAKALEASPVGRGKPGFQ